MAGAVLQQIMGGLFRNEITWRDSETPENEGVVTPAL